MNNDPNHARVYPMKNYWQYINRILGFWSWFCELVSIFASFCFSFIAPIAPWERKIIPAFRKMMTGVPRSYLRVSETGLEYRNWPFFELRCKWEDIQCLKKSRWLGDVLYLQRAEAFGFLEFSMKLSPPQIHLSSLIGWQDGGLEDDLQHYVPQLFRKSS